MRTLTMGGLLPHLILAIPLSDYYHHPHFTDKCNLANNNRKINLDMQVIARVGIWISESHVFAYTHYTVKSRRRWKLHQSLFSE